MKRQNLQSIIRKKWIVTTDSRHNYPVVKNKLNRDFNAARTGQAWVSDITYIKTSQGWLYLTVIIDLYDRKVIGWSFSRSLKAVYTTIPAWKIAIRNRPIIQVLIFHSDRGIQYACNEFKNLLSLEYVLMTFLNRSHFAYQYADLTKCPRINQNQTGGICRQHDKVLFSHRDE